MSHFVPMTIQGFSRFKGSNSSASSGKKDETGMPACRRTAADRPKLIPSPGVHELRYIAIYCDVSPNADGILGIKWDHYIQKAEDYGRLGILHENLQSFRSSPGEASPPLQEPDRVGSVRSLQHFSVGNRWKEVTYGHRKHCRKI